MKSILLFIVLIFVFGCASKDKKSAKFIERPQKNCVKVASLKSMGFSIIPFVGRAIARSVLEDKASDFKANSLVVTKESGLFHVEIEADGFRCKQS